MKGKHIGLFFGSFNPIHNGHMMIANYIAENSDFDQIWFVISPLNPFKSPKELLPDYHRRELLIRAVGDYPRFQVSSVEFKLPKPSYTIDTLDFLQKSYPHYDFTVIMGSDQLSSFPGWKQYDRILERFRVLVYPRPLDSSAISKTGIPDNALLEHPSIIHLNAPMIEISSSFIRKSLKEGKDVRFFMPSASWDYLDEMRFYR